MKRCPTCNRVETDDSLVFCRTDGTSLVSDSIPVSDEAGTVRLGSAPTEIETKYPSSCDRGKREPLKVKEFIYHRGGPKKPSVVIATWAGYKKAGPLLISTDHRGTADGKPLRISFSNVAVQLAGSGNWINAN